MTDYWYVHAKQLWLERRDHWGSIALLSLGGCFMSAALLASDRTYVLTLIFCALNLCQGVDGVLRARRMLKKHEADWGRH